MQYKIGIVVNVLQDKDIDFRTVLIDKVVGALDGQRIINNDGTGTIDVIEIEVERVASD